MSLTIEEEGVTTMAKGQAQTTRYGGLDRVEGGGVWGSLIIKNSPLFTVSSKVLPIRRKSTIRIGIYYYFVFGLIFDLFFILFKLIQYSLLSTCFL